jgi:hypothetical protein
VNQLEKLDDIPWDCVMGIWYGKICDHAIPFIKVAVISSDYRPIELNGRMINENLGGWVILQDTFPH